MSEEQVIIRECVTASDFQQCIELERAVWRDDDIDIMPIRLYLISKACKAPTFGAFDESGRLVGFVHTMIALHDGQVSYHSHMAAVIEEMRHRDIGYRLKLAQRDHAIRAGVPLIYWTFDPLQSRNAHFNLNKLGAIIRRYEPNYYGEGTSTMFDSGVPSDRVIAEWWVESPRVIDALAGKRPAADLSAPSVTIPDDINGIRAQSLEDHLRWRLRAREAFIERLASGQIVTGFVRDPELGSSRYLFGPDEEQFHYEAYQGVRAVRAV